MSKKITESNIKKHVRTPKALGPAPGKNLVPTKGFELLFRDEVKQIVNNLKPSSNIKPAKATPVNNKPIPSDFSSNTWADTFWYYGPRVGAAIALLALAAYIGTDALMDAIPGVTKQTLTNAHELAKNIPLPDITPQVLIDASATMIELPSVDKLIAEPTLKQYLLDIGETATENLMKRAPRMIVEGFEKTVSTIYNNVIMSVTTTEPMIQHGLNVAKTLTELPAAIGQGKKRRHLNSRLI